MAATILPFLRARASIGRIRIPAALRATADKLDASHRLVGELRESHAARVAERDRAFEHMNAAFDRMVEAMSVRRGGTR